MGLGLIIKKPSYPGKLTQYGYTFLTFGVIGGNQAANRNGLTVFNLNQGVHGLSGGLRCFNSHARAHTNASKLIQCGYDRSKLHQDIAIQDACHKP